MWMQALHIGEIDEKYKQGSEFNLIQISFIPSQTLVSDS